MRLWHFLNWRAETFPNNFVLVSLLKVMTIVYFRLPGEDDLLPCECWRSIKRYPRRHFHLRRQIRVDCGFLGCGYKHFSNNEQFLLFLPLLLGHGLYCLNNVRVGCNKRRFEGLLLLHLLLLLLILAIATLRGSSPKVWLATDGWVALMNGWRGEV